MTDATSTIYPPPRPGLPYLVVTFAEGAVVAQPAETRVEARATPERLDDCVRGESHGAIVASLRGCRANGKVGPG